LERIQVLCITPTKVSLASREKPPIDIIPSSHITRENSISALPWEPRVREWASEPASSKSRSIAGKEICEIKANDPQRTIRNGEK